MWLQFKSFVKEIQVCVLPCNLTVNFPLWLHYGFHDAQLETPYQNYPAIPLYNGIFLSFSC